MARKRINRGVVALGASAEAAVYMAGYLRTAPTDAVLDFGGVGVPVPIVSAAPLERVAAAPELVFTAPADGYRDGHYTGQGSTRRGDLGVSVDVAGGRITNVSITRSTMQFPTRDLAPLPAEVIERQAPRIDVISRATYSSQAFKTAVTQALSQAA
jgi:uncharacterized protein with FMN-binding domain